MRSARLYWSFQIREVLSQRVYVHKNDWFYSLSRKPITPLQHILHAVKYSSNMLTWKQAEVRSNKPNAFKLSEFITIFIAQEVMLN